MGKHTEGPWFVDHKSPFLVRAGCDISGRHIAHIGPANYTPRFDIDEPNALLIAAAPDLLEALTDALEDYDAWMKDADVTPNESLLAWTDKARSAIARAKGEE
jgi:hypothetical protein